MATTPGTSGLAPDKAGEVRAYVDQLLASPTFSSSVRRAHLLRYLVERELAGEGERTSEYAIGIDVFGKSDSFDPRVESTVRAEFSRLRQKLRDYYSGEGHADRIRIEFPQRSYVPSFRFLEDAEPTADVAPVAPPESRKNRAWLWIAAAICVLGAGAAGAWRFAGTRPQPIHSVVVLPFVNLSPDHNDDYVADGITEELTNDLAQVKDLRVVARTSASLFKGKGVDVREVGRKLNADTAIEGSIERQGDHLRITAQMCRTSDGYHVWSHSYDGSTKDVLVVQGDISRSIAATVAASMRKPTDAYAVHSTQDTKAHDLYLHAAYQYSRNTPDSERQALALFTQATEQDPNYVAAWIGIARSQINMVHFTVESPDRAFPAAKSALQKALSIDPSNGDARGLLAVLIASYDWDWPRAEREFRQAIADGARGAARGIYATLLATRGRYEEAHEQIRIAGELDPLGTAPRFNEFMVDIFEHKTPEAERVLHEVSEMYPNSVDVRFLRGTMAAGKDCNAARTDLNWCAKTFPSPFTKVGLAVLSAACDGDKGKARAYLKEAEKPDPAGYTSPYQLALVYTGIGDKETAISMLERSAQAKEMQILYIKAELAFDPLRSDPRFIALEKRVGIEP